MGGPEPWPILHSSSKQHQHGSPHVPWTASPIQCPHLHAQAWAPSPPSSGRLRSGSPLDTGSAATRCLLHSARDLAASWTSPQEPKVQMQSTQHASAVPDRGHCRHVATRTLPDPSLSLTPCRTWPPRAMGTEAFLMAPQLHSPPPPCLFTPAPQKNMCPVCKLP